MNSINPSSRAIQNKTYRAPKQEKSWGSIIEDIYEKTPDWKEATACAADFAVSGVVGALGAMPILGELTSVTQALNAGSNDKNGDSIQTRSVLASGVRVAGYACLAAGFAPLGFACLAGAGVLSAYSLHQAISD